MALLAHERITTLVELPERARFFEDLTFKSTHRWFLRRIGAILLLLLDRVEGVELELGSFFISVHNIAIQINSTNSLSFHCNWLMGVQHLLLYRYFNFD